MPLPDTLIFLFTQPETPSTNFIAYSDPPSNPPSTSIMAHDLLISSASIIVLKSISSTTGRLLTNTRNRLASEAIELSICEKNWLDAEMKRQNKKVHEIIEDSPEDE